MELFHPIYQFRAELSFYRLELVFAKKGKEYGSRETVLSLTAEDDCSYLQKVLPGCEAPKDGLYLVFQMFSGGELHIVAKEVSAEITG